MDRANVELACALAIVKQNETSKVFTGIAARSGISETVAHAFAKHGVVLLRDAENVESINALRNYLIVGCAK